MRHITDSRQGQAEALALIAIARIAGDEDMLTRFLGQTGCEPGQLRDRISDPVFLGAILDFVLESDETVQALADAAEIRPEDVLAARAHLPGSPMEWSETF